MNWDHIASVMHGRLQAGTFGDQKILTNGHIAVAVPNDSPLADGAKDFPRATALWEDALKVEVEPQAIGALYFDSRKLFRKIGAWFFSEHYFRCFLDCTWTHSKEHALVHHNGQLVGIVMRCREGNLTLAPKEDVPDTDVFAPFASEQNNWYLVNLPTLQAKLEDAEHQRDSIQTRINELETEWHDWENDCTSLRRQIEALKARSKANHGGRPVQPNAETSVPSRQTKA